MHPRFFEFLSPIPTHILNVKNKGHISKGWVKNDAPTDPGRGNERISLPVLPASYLSIPLS